MRVCRIEREREREDPSIDSQRIIWSELIIELTAGEKHDNQTNGEGFMAAVLITIKQPPLLSTLTELLNGHRSCEYSPHESTSLLTPTGSFQKIKQSKFKQLPLSTNCAEDIKLRLNDFYRLSCEFWHSAFSIDDHFESGKGRVKSGRNDRRELFTREVIELGQWNVAQRCHKCRWVSRQ